MYTKQLSVFLENRKGRLSEVLTILKDNNINISSASMADTNDFGLLRMLVDDTDKAQKVLKEKGITSKATDVIAIIIPNTVGSFDAVIRKITEADINIEYMYGISDSTEGASIAMKTSDPEKTLKAIEGMDIKFYGK
ncbi:MAG: ACT domain-containing protein [Lachnospiraceae bacterium]|nr:ACT domain-containing protein [Lachnospiraceae bacterium]